ncbi:hypothetical protein C1646_759613 [Rhizophagus diaphanus]|nr:hypothetical protein C1646_759613 [Rhizophagus diaphanus] [Rhizophagus sp. MUCL 43196]
MILFERNCGHIITDVYLEEKFKEQDNEDNYKIEDSYDYVNNELYKLCVSKEGRKVLEEICYLNIRKEIWLVICSKINELEKKSGITKTDKKRKRTINTADLETEVVENSEEKSKKYNNNAKRIKKRNYNEILTINILQLKIDNNNFPEQDNFNDYYDNMINWDGSSGGEENI